MKIFLCKAFLAQRKSLAPRFLRIVSITTIFLLHTFLSSAKIVAEKPINLNLKNVPLIEVVRKIENQTNYLFVFDEHSVDINRIISINIKNKTIDEVMTKLLNGTNIIYEVEGKNVILKRISGKERLSISPDGTQFSGRVLDKNKEPMIGVNIRIKGKKTGSVTDLDGKFTVNIDNGDNIIISYIGYITQEVETKNKTAITVIMEENTTAINEVVVVGYGTVQKRDLTGAVTTIKQDIFEQSRQSSFLNNMQGRVAGLQITSGSGEPGSGAKVIIRGANTIAGSSDPLYVIDGVQVNESEAPMANSQFGSNSRIDPLSSINPADIVSVEVLKDASSTAIYGAKGANGVIIITTRQGKEGLPVVSYDGRFGVANPSKKLEMLNGNEWIDYRKDWVLMPDKKNITYGYFNDWLFFLNSGKTNPSEMMPRDVYALPQYDWQKEMYKTALSTSHTIAVTGGNAFTKYAGSVGYNNEEGILMNNGYSRYNTRLKLDHSKDRIKLSLSINASYSKYFGAAQSGDGYNNVGVLQSVIVSRPLVFNNPLAEVNQGGWKMPTENLNHVSRTISSPNISSNLLLNYRLANGLYVGTTISGTLVNSGCFEFYDKSTPWGYYLNGRAAITNVEWMGWSNISTLFYSKNFKKNTKFNMLGVFELNGSQYQNSSIVKSNFVDGSTGIYDISKGITLQDASSGAGQANRVSYLGRFNYDLYGRYLITGSLRADGSDRFGENNRYGYFPSLALAWRVIEENFMKKQDLVNNLKIRLSYGRTGNSNIPEFQYMARMGNSFYGDELGLSPVTLPNPNLKWETTIQYNLGVDLSLWKSRIDLTLDLYDKNTTDMLYQAIIPAQSGSKTQWQNLGEVNNRGIEVGLSTKNIEAKNFTWTTNFTISANKNKIVNIGNGLDMAPIGAGSWSLSYIKLNDVGRIMTNQPIGVMYGYKMDGIYQMTDFSGWTDKTGVYPANSANIPWQQRSWILKTGVVDCSDIGASARPGTFKFSNIDGSTDNKITESDKTIIGKSQPLFFGGIGNNFQYKNFELNVFFNYSVGGEIFNSTKFELEGASPGEYYNITKDFWQNRWTPDNPTNKYPSYSDVNYYNTLAALPNSYYVEDASYLRLQTLSFSYTLPNSISKKMGISNLKLYYSGNNLLTLTKYSGFSPDVNSGNALLSGFDTIGYPRTTSHSFGLNLIF
ncbi:MAG: TonB-dependent receptor [Bacteroidales bacterium]|nr:TonB-dependent receptor [Bacteroidales bacterium]